MVENMLYIKEHESTIRLQKAFTVINDQLIQKVIAWFI